MYSKLKEGKKTFKKKEYYRKTCYNLPKIF